MAVQENISEVKVVIGLSKGSQTISKCKIDASADALYNTAMAVADLHMEKAETVYKVTKAELN